MRFFHKCKKIRHGTVSKLQPKQCRGGFRLQYLKTQLGSPAQAQQRLVLADQNVRFATGGKFEEFLVVAVLAARQGGRFTGGNNLHQAAVAGVALNDHFRCHLELRVGQHPLEFVERSRIDKAFNLPGLQRRHDRHGIGIGPMEEVEDDVGVEN